METQEQLLYKYIESADLENHYDELLKFDFSEDMCAKFLNYNHEIKPETVNYLIQILKNILSKADKSEYQNRAGINAVIKNARKQRVSRVLQDGEISFVCKRILFFKPAIEKLLGDCYMVLNDNYEAHKYYSQANSEWYDCSKELEMLDVAMNIGHQGKAYKFVQDFQDLYNQISGSHKKRIKELRKVTDRIIYNLLEYSTSLLDNATISNLTKSLNRYIEDEISDEEDDNFSDKAYLLTSGLERLLKNLFYNPYLDYLENKSYQNENNDEYSKFLQRLKINKNNTATSYTMGTFLSMVTVKKTPTIVLDEDFCKWVQLMSEIEDLEIVKDKILSLYKEVELVRINLRNPTAHGALIEKWRFEYFINKIMFEEGNILSQIIELSGQKFELMDIGEDIPTKEEVANTNWTASYFSFDEFYKALREYKNTYGNLNISLDYITPNKIKLGQWIRKVREVRHKGILNQSSPYNLTQKEYSKLDEIGFVWNSIPEMFEKITTALIKYKNEHQGSFDDVLDDEEIMKKINLLSFIYGSLTLIQKAIIKNIGIDVYETKKDRLKYKFYLKLCKAKEEYGDIHTALKKDEQLARKVTKLIQIYEKDNTYLSKNMYKKLKSLGLPFNDEPKPNPNDNFGL